MLFNSYQFLFVFLPIALIGYEIAGRWNRRAVVVWLGLASIGFYSYWNPAFVMVLLGSVALNYFAASLISRRIPNSVDSKAWLWAAIALDLGSLGYFKYLFPFLNGAFSILGSHHAWHNMLLPLGISFFTFTQIAFLVDLQQGIALQQDLSSYVLFVTFFPHLIAGPILHHKDIMPQFQQDRRYRLSLDDFSIGFTWFILGLSKKVLLADYFALSANPAFATGHYLGVLAAWRGVISYSLQLYFDFSGYSDMALGLARMFSIDFPLNFSSPYKARNIIDFWQRWHITLTQYITAYVYSPLQFRISAQRQEKGLKVSRKAQSTPEGFFHMIAMPMATTMLIAGLWHGAGFQFLLYGLLHGIYLSINHAWRLFRHKRYPQQVMEQRSRVMHTAMHCGSVLLTFFAVIVAQIFFRANSTTDAFHMLASLFGFHNIGGSMAMPGEDKNMLQTAAVVVGLSIVWFMPNTQQILKNFKPSLQLTEWDKRPVAPQFRWAPKLRWATAVGTLLLVCLIYMQDPSTFLYFQF